MRLSASQVKTGFKALLFLLLASASFSAWAQQSGGQTPGIYNRIWGAADLYDNADNTVIQSFSLIGRYHGQYWSVHGDDASDSDWENRRMIIGFSSGWYRDFKLQAQMFIGTGDDPLYNGLYEAFVQWSPTNSDYSLSVGRLDYLFTGLERSTSSKRINAIERGLLVNQLMPGEVVGAHLRGKQAGFSWHSGVFSRGIREEFDDFDSGAAAVLGASIDAPLWLEDGSLQLDYLYNPGDSDDGADDNAFKAYRHTVSLWHRGQSGRWGMGTDLTYARALEDGGHVVGLTLEPTLKLLDGVTGNNDPLQLAVRYQYARSNTDNGLKLQKRYEGEVTSGRGDHYQALYAGLNYFLYDHKFKFMLGGEYARMKDAADDGGEYSGWTWFGAVRLYF